jgi:acetyl-CoA carboxylase beta subunit
LRRSTPREREEHGLVEVTGVKGKRAEAMASEFGGCKCAHCHRLIFHAKLEEQPRKCAVCRSPATGTNAARAKARVAQKANTRSDDPAAAIYNHLDQHRRFKKAVEDA